MVEPAMNKTATGNKSPLPVEILQQIFSDLDMWTLLRCRCVCRVWNSSIPGNSPGLRKILFLPTSSDKIRKTYAKPLTIHMHLIFNEMPQNSPTPQHATGYSIGLVPGELFGLRDNHGISLHPIFFFDITHIELETYRNIWRSSDAIKPFWMTMLLCQPRIREVDIHLHFPNTSMPTEECIERAYTNNRRIRNPRGVVLGQVLSAVCDAAWWPAITLKEPEYRRLHAVPGEEQFVRDVELESDDDVDLRPVNLPVSDNAPRHPGLELGEDRGLEESIHDELGSFLMRPR